MQDMAQNGSISIHALREEGDFPVPPSHSSERHFYPRPPRGGRPRPPGLPETPAYFYPRPPRGGRLEEVKNRADSKLISIHALREEGDALLSHISLRNFIFLSTPSARRATRQRRGIRNDFSISIHALREEGDQHVRRRGQGQGISIHALREEGDPYADPATNFTADISIHALREEGDFTGWATLPASTGFLSTPSARRATIRLRRPL